MTGLRQSFLTMLATGKFPSWLYCRYLALQDLFPICTHRSRTEQTACDAKGLPGRSFSALFSVL